MAENRFASFLKRMGEPENFANKVLPILAVVESIATKGQSPGTTAMGQQQMILGNIDRKRKQGQEDAAFAEEQEQRAESARQRAIQKKLQEQLGTLDTSNPDAYKQAVDMAIKSGAVAPKEMLDYVAKLQRPASGGLSGWSERTKDWDIIAQMPDGEEKQQAITEYLYKWSPSSGYNASPQAIEQAVKRQRALIPGAIEQSAGSAAAAQVARRNIGETLSETAAERLGDFGASLGQLNTLVQSFSNPDAPQGPIAQIRKINPYDWEAQAKQQLVASTKQLVGKALEGGVLRKEDEDKYNKILPTLADTYSSATAKANNLITMLNTAYTSKRGALKSAGYDVSGFKESYYQPSPAQPAAPQQPNNVQSRKIELARQALNDPQATPEEKAKAQEILRKAGVQ